LLARHVTQEYQSSQDLFVKKFEITEMPQYLLVHVSRFTKNTFFTEKNPTIVNFPVKCVRSLACGVALAPCRCVGLLLSFTLVPMKPPRAT